MDPAEMVMPYVEALTAPDIEFGKALWQSLRANKLFPVNGMFWLFQLKSGNWHLLIATPEVDKVGPKDAYAELANIIRGLLGDLSQFSKIELISPKHPFYQALHSVFGNTASVEGVRLGNTQIGGMYIDDAYLYEIR